MSEVLFKNLLFGALSLGAGAAAVVNVFYMAMPEEPRVLPASAVFGLMCCLAAYIRPRFSWIWAILIVSPSIALLFIIPLGGHGDSPLPGRYYLLSAGAVAAVATVGTYAGNWMAERWRDAKGGV